MEKYSNNRSSQTRHSSSYNNNSFRRDNNFDITTVDYKNVQALQKFVTEHGRIIPSRVTGLSAKKQREIALAIKRARFLALIPYKAA
ncbi:MAG: 30S ribosomal protein S18 [Holosporales bacterium]|jgi:small subunit ribosomal protein S18|nr:30S ribosomal protein S18 [Holosporales bacterium]